MGDVEILPTFRKEDRSGGWQRVEIPRAGNFVLRLTYEAEDVSEGLAVSAFAWMCWLTTAVSCAFHWLFSRTDLRSPRPEA